MVRIISTQGLFSYNELRAFKDMLTGDAYAAMEPEKSAVYSKKGVTPHHLKKAERKPKNKKGGK